MEVNGIPVNTREVTVTRYEIEVPVSVFGAACREDVRTLRDLARDVLWEKGAQIEGRSLHFGPIKASFTDTSFSTVQIAVATMVARVASLRAEFEEQAA